ncbi:dipeptidase [Selenomonadales bacterium OttesenSCG-928-I06]|nr:dipeptidase [Selenomonadales bacterium OttesenSCG-928-I06]
MPEIIDFHCDTLSLLKDSVSRCGANLKSNNFGVDLEKLKKAGSIAQFFAMFIDQRKDTSPFKQTIELCNVFYKEIQENSNEISLALNLKDFNNIRAENKIAAFLTIENGAALEGNLDNLTQFYNLGIRLITLTWNHQNEIGFPHCYTSDEEQKLTPFGIELIENMNQLGIIIDVSHLSDQGFYDVAKYSKAPFIASHSNARSVHNHSRNLTDDMIKIIGDTGGIIGINFEKSFLSANNTDFIQAMVAHINHIHKIGGIDSLALGSDFDGIEPNPEIIDISQLYKLIDELKNNGFNDDAIDKFCSKNALRVISDCLKENSSN